VRDVQQGSATPVSTHRTTTRCSWCHGWTRDLAMHALPDGSAIAGSRSDARRAAAGRASPPGLA
jgi:hypothetical protein